MEPNPGGTNPSLMELCGEYRSTVHFPCVGGAYLPEHHCTHFCGTDSQSESNESQQRERRQRIFFPSSKSDGQDCLVWQDQYVLIHHGFFFFFPVFFNPEGIESNKRGIWSFNNECRHTNITFKKRIKYKVDLIFQFLQGDLGLCLSKKKSFCAETGPHLFNGSTI